MDKEQAAGGHSSTLRGTHEYRVSDARESAVSGNIYA